MHGEGLRRRGRECGKGAEKAGKHGKVRDGGRQGEGKEKR